MSVRNWSLEAVLTVGTRVGLDSNILIYLLEGDGPRADAAASILDGIAEGRVVGILASLGLTEVLAGFARDRDATRFETVAAEIGDLGLRIRGLDRGLAVDAAWIRSEGMALEDAVHVATARVERADVFVTNDRRIRSRPGFDVAYLDDMIA